MDKVKLLCNVIMTKYKSKLMTEEKILFDIDDNNVVKSGLMFFIIGLIVMIVLQKYNSFDNDSYHNYVLLYLYFDNYIDSINISDENKQRCMYFCYNIYHGIDTVSHDIYNNRIAELYHSIRSYNIDEYIYEIFKYSASNNVSDLTQLYKISNDKGGFSVVPILNFSKESFTIRDIWTMYRIGQLVQVFDDYFDLEDDISKGRTTYATLYKKLHPDSFEKDYRDLIKNLIEGLDNRFSMIKFF